MKRQFGQRQIPLAVLLTVFLLVDVAQAEVNRVYFSSDTRWTLISCAAILAGGMIVAAAIFRRPK